jgi:hypothetical protein
VAVNVQKLIPSTLSKSLESVQGIQKSSSVTISEKSATNIAIIKVKVVEIENILKGTLASQKKQLDNKKRTTSQLRREKLESDLETKPNLNDGKVGFPKAPRMGFLDWIKNFIGKTILGYFAVRMIDYLPKLMPFIKVIGGAADFVINVGGKLLDGLVTFVDWGYKAYDATRGFLKNVGGENFAKRFDEFSGVVNTLVDTLIISAIVLGNQGAGGGFGGGKRPGGRPKVTQGRGGTSPGLRFPGTGPKVTMGAGGKKGLLYAVRPFLKRIPVPVIGALIDFGLSVALGESPGRAAFRAIGAGLLGYIGAGLAGVLGLTTGPGAVAAAALGYIAGGALGDMAGGALYDIFFGGKSVSKSTTQKMAGGGPTRGGRTRGSVKRAIGGKKEKGKYKRGVARKPGKVEINSPGADIGGEKKLFGLFPDPLKALQKVADAINPFKAIKTAGEELGNTSYFGPILAITSKITAGQKPTQQDYQNVGFGINLLIAKGIQDQQLKGGIVAAFAEGGLVDPDILSAAETGGDISNWVAKTFQGEIESNAQKTLRMIRENAEKKKYEEGSKDETENVGGTAGQFSPEGLQGDIYKYLLSKGMSDNHALGIMANIHRESGFRPGVSESGGPGVGLFQYSSGGRKSAFLKAVSDYATNWKGQIDFAIKEDVAPEYFKQNFSSAQDAADWWMRKWERPAEYIQNDKGPKIHAQYLAGLQKYKTQKGYQIPGSMTEVSTSIATGSIGDRQKNAGELGSFIKSLGVAKGSGVHEHPQHGGIKYQHKGRGHYEGRAIDIGGYGGRHGRSKLGKNFINDQSAILSAINQFSIKTGKKPSLVLHGDNDPGHWDHVHAEYERGGETLGYPHIARLGERGREVVIDADSAGPAKDMLLAINQAKDHRGVMKAIQQYAPYDALAPQTIVVPSTTMPRSMEDYGEDGGGLTLIASATEEGSDPMNVLYKGG